MNLTKLKQQLNEKYPDSQIFENQNAFAEATEVLCEIEPTSDHSEYSKAIAIIDRSKPHYHKKTKETYKVLKGNLKLFIEGELIELGEDDEYEIPLNKIHWAYGDKTWVECYSEPGWTMEDHLFPEMNISVAGFVINEKSEFILVRQSDGIYSLPKGRQEKGESVEDTVIREIKEETGITNFELKKVLGEYYREQVGDPGVYKNIVVFLATAKKTTLTKTNADDVECAKWVTESEMLSQLSSDTDRYFFQQFIENREKVLGIVTKNNKVIIGKVLPDKIKDFGGIEYVFPGGSVNLGEGIENAVIREIEEETGYKSRITRKIGERVHPKTYKTIHYFHCNITKGQETTEGVDNDDIEEIIWVDIDEIKKYMPTIYPKILDYFSNLNRKL